MIARLLAAFLIAFGLTAAALILRWSAQLAAGEDAVTLSGCRIPLRDYGYNLDLLEPLVADLAREVLTYVAQVAPTPSGPWRC